MDPPFAGREALRRDYATTSSSFEGRPQRSGPLLMTMPEIGPISALDFRSSVDDSRRFLHSQSVCAYWLTPRRYQSGGIDRVGRITKVGDGETRMVLFEAAKVVFSGITRWSPMKTWAVRVAQRQGGKRARSRWPERWLSFFIVCESMEPNSDGQRRRNDAMAHPKRRSSRGAGWSSLHDRSWRPPPGAAPLTTPKSLNRPFSAHSRDGDQAFQTMVITDSR
ncbi:hypothetical protein ACVWXM_009686 [Bradyrhizobium sp. GM7.3]